jgi:hypothetical protein
MYRMSALRILLRSLALSAVACMAAERRTVLGIDPESPNSTLTAYAQAEPLWPALARGPQDFAASWAQSDLKLLKLAERGSIIDLEQSAAKFWQKLINENGEDIPAARLAYLRGTFSSERARELAAFHANVQAYLRTTVINADKEPAMEKYFYETAVSSSPFLNEILLEELAEASLYPFNGDERLFETYFTSAMPPSGKLPKEFSQRAEYVNAAQRTLLITARNCEDYGLWPTMSNAVVGNANMSGVLSAWEPSLHEVTTYLTTLSVINKSACSDEIIRSKPETWPAIQNRVTKFQEGHDRPDPAIRFYRALAHRNAGLGLAEKSGSP